MDIENITHNCNGCLLVTPKFITSFWKWLEQPWTKVRCYFMGHFQNRYVFVAVDVTTKHLVVFAVNFVTAEIGFNIFSKIIAYFIL